MLFRDAMASNPSAAPSTAPHTRRKPNDAVGSSSEARTRRNTEHAPSCAYAPSDTTLTPTDIHRTLCQLVASCDTLTNMRVAGEMANVSPTTRSGHMYFDLKDARGSKLSCTLFGVDRVVSAETRPLLQNGVQVVVRGSVRCSCKYSGSQYQCNVREVRVTATDEGTHEKQLELWRKALTSEGVFAADRKRPVPEFPRVVGVVTSDGGAALQDVRQTLKDAAVPFAVRVYPCTVQGDACVPTVLAQLETICGETRGRPDVVLLTRGGGSREDLWAFNSPALVRGIDAMRAVGGLPPIVCAIGHQIDTPLVDGVCDRACITPTCAAQTLAQPFQDLRRSMRARHQSLHARVQQCATHTHLRHSQLAHAVRQYKFHQHLRHTLSTRHDQLLRRVRRQADDAPQRSHVLVHALATAAPWHALTKQTNLAVLKTESGEEDFDVRQFATGKRGTLVLVTGDGEVVLHYRVGAPRV